MDYHVKQHVGMIDSLCLLGRHTIATMISFNPRNMWLTNQCEKAWLQRFYLSAQSHNNIQLRKSTPKDHISIFHHAFIVQNFGSYHVHGNVLEKKNFFFCECKSFTDHGCIVL